MTTIMERNEKGVVTTAGMQAKVPNDISMVAIFAVNGFVSGGDYREDGFIYMDNKPVKKWFKKIGGVLVWFPILQDLKRLQDRFKRVGEAYKKYRNKEYAEAADQLLKVKKAHAMVTHKFSGNSSPWWLYSTDEYGISFNWVEKPQSPQNLDIGNAYYKAAIRLEQLGYRLNAFRGVLRQAVEGRIMDLNIKGYIKGYPGQLLRFEIDQNIYWFQHGRHTWEKLVFPEDNVIVIKE